MKLRITAAALGATLAFAAQGAAGKILVFCSEGSPEGFNPMVATAGTTFDAFNMLWEARKYGARAALFGRKINSAEHQLSFVAQLRALADGCIEPPDAVRAYHAELAKLGLTPHRPLADDLEPSPRERA